MVNTLAEGLLMDLRTEFLSSPHFLGKEMLNFAEGEVHRQAIPALIASVTLYQIRTDKSHLTPLLTEDTAIFLLGLMTI